jgi:3-phenylpropionate/trans-cinnamate dioxygenase ferredoxin reductase subunit
MADPNKPVVIVGAGQAGARAAEALRRNGFAGRIVLVGEEPELPYERPPLSKSVLTGEKPASIATLLPSGFYGENRIELLTSTRVGALDARAKRAILADGRTLDYGSLILCTGGRVRTLPFAPIGRPGVHYLRTLADCARLGEALRAAHRVAVVGAGFLGLEVAAAARKLGLEATVIEAKPHVLDRAMVPEIAQLVERIHREKGVAFHLGASVTGISGAPSVEAVTLADGTRIPADLVIVAIGIVPNVELAADAGAAIEDGIIVDEFGRTSLADVYAAGDVANHPNPILGRRLRLESWQNAQNQAIATARGMYGTPAPYAEVPWFWSDQFDFNIQMAGAPLRTDEIVVRGEPGSGHFMGFNLAQGAVVGATAFNMGGEIRFARRMIESGVRVDPAALADPTRKLRDIG